MAMVVMEKPHLLGVLILSPETHASGSTPQTCSTTGLPRSAVLGVLGGGQLGRMMALAAVSFSDESAYMRKRGGMSLMLMLKQSDQTWKLEPTPQPVPKSQRITYAQGLYACLTQQCSPPCITTACRQCVTVCICSSVRACVCVCVCVRACVRVYVCVHVYACLFACRISSCLCHLLRMRAGELGGAHEVP